MVKHAALNPSNGKLRGVGSKPHGSRLKSPTTSPGMPGDKRRRGWTPYEVLRTRGPGGGPGPWHTDG